MTALMVLFVALSAGAQSLQEPAELFLSSNQAFLEERFEDAATGYQQLIDGDVAGAQVHYNQGNAWLRAGRLGEAIAAYRRAEELAPRDADIQANLQFARKSAQDAVAPPGPSDIQRTALFWHYALSPTERLGGLAVANTLFWCLLGLRLVWRRSEWLRWGPWVMAVPLLAFAGSAVAHRVFPSTVAVVVTPDAEVRAGDDEAAVLRFVVHAGTEVTFIQRRNAWVRIGLSDGQGGWVRAESLR